MIEIEKRGRPRTSKPTNVHSANMRAASARYYAKNRELILKKAHDKHINDKLLKKLKESGRILPANDKTNSVI